MDKRWIVVSALGCLFACEDNPDPLKDMGREDMAQDMLVGDMSAPKDQNQDQTQSADLDDLDQDTSQDMVARADASPDMVDMEDMSKSSIRAGICSGNPSPHVLTQGDLGRAQVVARSAMMNGQNHDFSFLEGPVWLSALGKLVWSDFNNSSPLAQDMLGPPTILFAYTPGGEVEVFAPEGKYRSNGLAVDESGHLLMANHGVRGITRLELSTQRLDVLADAFEDKAFNTTNDLVAHRNGAIYFTDPAYGGQVDGRPTPLNIEGVYRWHEGQVTLVTDALQRPNGITLSVDESWLYVADIGAKIVYRASVDLQGQVGELSRWVEGVGVDGMTVDCADNVYLSVPGTGVLVYDARGVRIGKINHTQNVTNVAFGGADHKTLFITERQALKQRILPVAGLPY